MFKAFEFCLPTTGTKVPAGTEWLHEIKYDGFRLRVEREGDRVRLITRGGFDRTKRYQWIVEAALKNRQKRFVIDGEAVVLGVDGISDFDALLSGSRRGPKHHLWTMSDDCIVCGKWPERERWALREMLDTLPMDDEPICDECLMAFRERCSRHRSRHSHTSGKRTLSASVRNDLYATTARNITKANPLKMIAPTRSNMRFASE
jgi:hypothetical protein